MEGLVGTYPLLNRRTGKEIDATLWRPLSERHVQDFLQRWKPVLDARVAELGNQGSITAAKAAEHNVQDAHWQWSQKLVQRRNGLAWTSFAVEVDGATQGLMFARMDAFAREASQLNKPIVDIDLLATAPWNRFRLDPNPLFKGVGRLLLAAAVSLSVSEEFCGRVGLHALPQADSWYRDVCGMCDLGVDSTGMRYFEMTDAQAQAFLNS